MYESNLTDKAGLKAAVMVKEISTINKKPDNFHWENNRDVSRAIPYTLKTQAYENANSQERREPQLYMPLKGFPAP